MRDQGEMWTGNAWTQGASPRISVPGSSRDGTGEKNTGLRQRVQRVELDLEEAGNGMENVMCTHCIKACIKIAQISLLKASTNF